MAIPTRKRYPMTDIGLPADSPPIRAAQIAAILAAALVAASIRVEECWIVPGAFSKDFSSGFDVSRRVCGRAALAVVLAHNIQGAARAIILDDALNLVAGSAV
jgi:hypothetical protein